MRNLKKSKNLLQIIIVNNWIRSFHRTFGDDGLELTYIRKHQFNRIIYGKYHKIWAIEYGKYPKKKINIHWDI